LAKPKKNIIPSNNSQTCGTIGDLDLGEIMEVPSGTVAPDFEKQETETTLQFNISPTRSSR